VRPLIGRRSFISRASRPMRGIGKGSGKAWHIRALLRRLLFKGPNIGAVTAASVCDGQIIKLPRKPAAASPFTRSGRLHPAASCQSD
jgi:hypothetical protein